MKKCKGCNKTFTPTKGCENRQKYCTYNCGEKHRYLLKRKMKNKKNLIDYDDIYNKLSFRDKCIVKYRKYKIRLRMLKLKLLKKLLNIKSIDILD